MAALVSVSSRFTEEVFGDSAIFCMVHMIRESLVSGGVLLRAKHLWWELFLSKKCRILNEHSARTRHEIPSADVEVFM